MALPSIVLLLSFVGGLGSGLGALLFRHGNLADQRGTLDCAAISVGAAIVVIALYLTFGFVALAIDQRALLVSGLAYVVYAMASLIRTAGAVEMGRAFTALVVGAALLTLSAFWQPLRMHVVEFLGGLAERLPPTRRI